MTKPSNAKTLAGATIALVLLTTLNFINYIDRYILPGVQEMVKGEFHVSDEHIGALTFWFFMAYIIAAPLTGWIGDHLPRKPLIVAAALLWSVMNLLTATVHTFDALLWRHAALGIGEASFGIFAPAVLSDFYPAEQRNRIMTIFNLAVPLGAALGYLIGGAVGQHYGWRAPFYVSAIPGIALALLILFVMKEPERGASESDSQQPESRKGTLKELATNPAYITAVLGYAMATFTLGGISWWIPSFLQRFAGQDATQAGFTVGAITVSAGVAGTIAGGVWAQRWLRTNHRALYLVSGYSALSAIPPALLCFFGPKAIMLPALAVAIFAIFLGTGPLNAAVINAVSARVRATALAGELFLLHALGDAPSPRIIGAVSDTTNLRYGLAVTTIALLAAGAILIFGARYATPPKPQLESAA